MAHQLYEIAVFHTGYLEPDWVAGPAALTAAIVDRRVAVDAVCLHWLAHTGAKEATRR